MAPARLSREFVQRIQRSVEGPSQLLNKIHLVHKKVEPSDSLKREPKSLAAPTAGSTCSLQENRKQESMTLGEMQSFGHSPCLLWSHFINHFNFKL